MKSNNKIPEATKAKIDLKSKVLEKHSDQACNALGLDITIWNEYHLKLRQAPTNLLLMYFIYIEQYLFNPLCQDIIFFQSLEQSWKLLITVDGWAKYMNRHPQFKGIHFQESTETIDGIATWIECSIYRNDRAIATTVREYYQEVKVEHESWMQMPRRMLRHKALSQCARLAFGISPADESALSIVSLSSNNDPNNQAQTSPQMRECKLKTSPNRPRVELLREKLGQLNDGGNLAGLRMPNEAVSSKLALGLITASQS